jgi:hypothetical protein
MRKSSCAASCSTSCPAVLSASALSGSWPIGGAPLSYPSVSACSPTIPCRTHPQPLLLHPPSPLVSAVQNVPLPWSSSNDFLYSLLGISLPGARSLTLPNQPTILLSTARASTPTAAVSPFSAVRFHPPLTFLNPLHRIVVLQRSRLLLTLFPTPPNPSRPRTNRESPMQNA